MAGVVIADAGPLIALATIDHLDLLRTLFATVQVTEAVCRECLAKATLDSSRIEEAVAAGWLLIQSDPADRVDAPVSLGIGEWASIQLAECNPEKSLLILDDRLARRHALDRGLKVIGTVRLLALAEDRALIPDAGALIGEMREQGYRISLALLQQVRSLR